MQACKPSLLLPICMWYVWLTPTNILAQREFWPCVPETELSMFITIWPDLFVCLSVNVLSYGSLIPSWHAIGSGYSIRSCVGTQCDRRPSDILCAGTLCDALQSAKSTTSSCVFPNPLHGASSESTKSEGTRIAPRTGFSHRRGHCDRQRTCMGQHRLGTPTVLSSGQFSRPRSTASSLLWVVAYLHRKSCARHCSRSAPTLLPQASNVYHQRSHTRATMRVRLYVLVARILLWMLIARICTRDSDACTLLDHAGDKGGRVLYVYGRVGWRTR
ncbi:hypothetical protein C8Q73DRAFT_308507 [Cubamyces lactineus]|nr:hypothetical protein C8Q73DRAFT_308507 [Cubamyces lactineus]